MVLNAVTRSDLASVALILGFFSLLGGCTGSSMPDEGDLQPLAGSPITSGGSSSGGTTSGSSGNPPTITLNANQLTVDQGGSATISWSAAGADSCTASGGWSGTLSASGSRSVGPLTQGTTFSLTCAGPGGSALEMIALAVIGPVSLSWVAPDENVDGSPLTDLAGYRIYYGQTSRSYSTSIDLTDPLATSYTMNVASGDYYVAMTAFDSLGNESGYSNEVVKVRL